MCSSQPLLIFIYKNSKVTHVNISVHICIWGLFGARQEVATSTLIVKKFLMLEIGKSPMWVYLYIFVFEACGCQTGSCYFQRCCFFSVVQKKVTYSLVDVLNKQTTNLYCPPGYVLLLYCFCYACHLVFWVGLLHTPRVSMGVTLLDFFFGWAAALRPNILWSTAPIQKSTIETTLMGFPSMLKWVVPSRHGMEQVKCVYTILPMKTVYRHDIKCRQIYRPTNTSQMPGRLVSASNAKFWYLHGSWFQVVCVPHLSGTCWSRLPWDVLLVSDVAIPEGSASAGSLSTDGTGA